ncbi:MAG TPA: lipocalin-like domain-containing protein [Acidobacteriota bacterium]|nr:lipocalin-like domain-containing protein [Acidobacteriota bacterium]
MPVVQYPKHGSFRATLALIALLAGCGGPAAAPATSAPPLVGAWTLVSWQRTAADGAVTDAYGGNAAGQIVYTANGRMSAQLMRPGREFPEAESSTGEEMRSAILGGFFSYYGTYTVDHDNAVVTHNVEGALLPSWVGSQRPRAFTFDGPDRVTLSTAPDPDRTNGAVSVLVWERVSSGQGE